MYFTYFLMAFLKHDITRVFDTRQKTIIFFFISIIDYNNFEVPTCPLVIKYTVLFMIDYNMR